MLRASCIWLDVDDLCLFVHNQGNAAAAAASDETSENIAIHVDNSGSFVQNEGDAAEPGCPTLTCRPHPRPRTRHSLYQQDCISHGKHWFLP
jgi:hypothetical protein